MNIDLFFLIRYLRVTSYLISSMLFVFFVSSCNPIYAFAWTGDFDHPVDIFCIENSLKKLTKEVYKANYISTGDRGFPKGIEVTQFTYIDPGKQGAFAYDIAQIDLIHTHVYHVFEKTGNRPTDEYVRKSVNLLNYNNDKVASACNLRFSERDFKKPWYFR